LLRGSQEQRRDQLVQPRVERRVRGRGRDVLPPAPLRGGPDQTQPPERRRRGARDGGPRPVLVARAAWGPPPLPHHTQPRPRRPRGRAPRPPGPPPRHPPTRPPPHGRKAREHNPPPPPPAPARAKGPPPPAPHRRKEQPFERDGRHPDAGEPRDPPAGRRRQ